MLRTYIMFDNKKIELTEIEFYKENRTVIGVDKEGNRYRVPADDIIIEEDFK